TVGVVLLHMGDRPGELTRALETLHQQQGVELDVVLVGNGWEPEGLPDWVRTVHLPVNVGVPEGRNIGAAECRGEFIQFYDDDAAMPTPDTIARPGRRRAAARQPLSGHPASLRQWLTR